MRERDFLALGSVVAERLVLCLGNAVADEGTDSGVAARFTKARLLNQSYMWCGISGPPVRLRELWPKICTSFA